MAVIRKGRPYKVEEILAIVVEKSGVPIRIELDGNPVCVNSDKLITFKQKGVECVDCHIQGQYFVKEKHQTKRGGEYFHLNLYAVDANGNEVLMTKDHIMPRSLGGYDDISNYQPMCTECNKKKADKINEKIKKEKEKTMNTYLKNQNKRGNFALAAALKKALQKD